MKVASIYTFIKCRALAAQMRVPWDSRVGSHGIPGGTHGIPWGVPIGSQGWPLGDMVLTHWPLGTQGPALQRAPGPIFDAFYDFCDFHNLVIVEVLTSQKQKSAQKTKISKAQQSCVSATALEQKIMRGLSIRFKRKSWKEMI